jgi:hypothetical protein
MGASIDNRVVLICKEDESDWKPDGINDKPVGSYGYECLPNEDWLVVSEWDFQECINEFIHTENGTLVQLDSNGAGVIAIDRLALPKSTEAIIRFVSHTQGEDIHFVETVKASDIEEHNWSLANKEDIQLLYAPPPPDNWKGDSDDWWESEALSNYQLDFDENLEKAFNTAVLDALTAVKAGIDISSLPTDNQVFVLDADSISDENPEKHSIVPTLEEVVEFNDALNDCYLDRHFKQAEKYKSLILGNIKEITEIYTEDNVATLGMNPPAWLVTAFEDNEGYYTFVGVVRE